jgi:formylglycine-generating enzyme required for sulfatase activity
MADTRRGISWSLERPCPLRGGEDWTLPSATHRQLGDISAYSNALQDGRVLDDICVTGRTYSSGRPEEMVLLPCSGFRVSLALARFGGEEAVRAACGECEANVAPVEPPVLASCHGFLQARPDSEELETELREKVRLKGLEEEVTCFFPRTTPLWYGFWIQSPLRRPQCEVLLALLHGSDDPGDKSDDDLRHFLAALQAAVDLELPLHVEMAPPGHVDCGWSTVFPHCPRCKADAPVARWQQSYSNESIDCQVCGQRYSPGATHKSEPEDESAWEAQRLDNVLGAGEVEAFSRRFLAHQGYSAKQIDDIFDGEHKGPLKRRINDLRRRQKTVRRALPSRKTMSTPMPPHLVLNLGGDVTMRLRLVPDGEFLMGSTGLPDEVATEGPQHQVRIARPFYLGEFPVTQAQYEAVMGHNPSQFEGDSDRPVEQVSWFAAQEFCMRLTQATGRWVRLPTEAEWEYACRAGTTSKYPWGEEVTAEKINAKIPDPLETFPTKADLGTEEICTTVQGRYAPNPWGFFDMLGNVEEWCEDEWHDRYEGSPAHGSAWVTAGDENPLRSTRGGSCWLDAAVCTSAGRGMTEADHHDEPYAPPEDNPFLQHLFQEALRHQSPVGFRVVVAGW